MAITITATWTEDQSVTMSDASPADGVTSTGDIDLDTNGYDAVLVQIRITWHASATDYADINFYMSADSGSNDDTVAYYNRRVDADAGNTTRLSQLVRDVPYAQVAVTNQSNQEIASLVVDYAGRTWQSD